ncbi:MAG: hypothetical protein K0R26_1186 [Bacteroidota bacterium]|jgi:hypothetical protein|nr:hypothetical protein [Bacteroidota bacterium]
MRTLIERYLKRDLQKNSKANIFEHLIKKINNNSSEAPENDIRC